MSPIKLLLTTNFISLISGEEYLYNIFPIFNRSLAKSNIANAIKGMIIKLNHLYILLKSECIIGIYSYFFLFLAFYYHMLTSKRQS